MRTSLYSILCIVIRLGAVLLAMKAFGTALTLVATWRQTGDLIGVWPATAILLFVLLVAFMLWLYPGLLARAASGRSATQVFESPISAEQLQWVALSVLGAYFVLSGLVGLSYFLFLRLAIGTIVGHDVGVNDTIANGLYWIVQIGLGAGLTLGAKGLAGLLQRLRYGDIDPMSESSGANDEVDVASPRD